MTEQQAAAKNTGTAAYSMPYRWYVVGLLTLAYTMYTADRILLGVLFEPIKQEFNASDAQMGFVSLLAAITYAISIIPLGLLADRVNRRKLLFVILCGWSVFTAICGFARQVWHVAAAQMVVTANEGGGGPTMNSLISDLFPRAKRGLPVGLWYCGISLGAFVGFSGGGYLADAYGWRMTFIVLGAPGLVIALLVLLTVRETPRGMSDGVAVNIPARPDFKGTLSFLGRQKGLRHAIYAQCLTGLSQMGPIAWMVSFLHRSHGASFATAGFATGIIFLVTGLLSAPSGGLLMDRLGKRDVRWHGTICAWMMMISAIAFGGIYLLQGLTLVFAAIFVWQLVINAVSPITVAMVANLAPAHFRGLSLSLGFLLFHLFGFGVGSQLIGVVSDTLANSFAVSESDALRYACLFALVFHVWGAWHYRIAARHAREGYEHAEALESAAS